MLLYRVCAMLRRAIVWMICGLMVDSVILCLVVVVMICIVGMLFALIMMTPARGVCMVRLFFSLDVVVRVNVAVVERLLVSCLMRRLRVHRFVVVRMFVRC